jgi:hypothetical protein
MYRLISAALVVVALSTGCGLTPATQVTNPVVNRQPSVYASTMADVITTDASQRAVLIDKETFGFCAEASPDVTKDTAAALNEALKITASLETGVGATGGLGVEAGGGFNRETAAAALSKIIFTPSQGIQLYRVGGFNLCQAWINNTITTGMFLEQHTKLLEIVKALTFAEILVRHSTQAQFSDTQLQNILETIAKLQDTVAVSNGLQDSEEGRQRQNTVPLNTNE